MNVYEKLAKVQAELKAPKNQYNSFGKYAYRSAEDILSAAKPLCVANGLLLTLSDEIKEIGGRIYVEATATATDTENDNSFVSATASAREPQDKKGMDDSQITGAASSYARKYALNGLFAIDDTKDADTMPPPIKEYKCADCGKEVKAYKTFTAAQMASRAIEKFGRCLCVDCAKAAAEKAAQ